jgi:putative transcriptional regulator
MSSPSLKGNFLIASPHLSDANFFRTVVLLVKHNHEGAFGLILNRPACASIGEVWEQVSEEKCKIKAPIRIGGPVQGPLMALHTMMSSSEAEILPGLYFASNRDNLARVLHREDKPFLLFSGYAGWGEGQLENEIEHGGWLKFKADHDWVFADIDTIWKRAVCRVGDEILNQTLKPKHRPPDPRHN